MRALLLKTAKVVAVFFGVWLGYVAGFLISFYGGDRDVGSVLGLVVWVPVGVLVCSIAAYVVATIALRRLSEQACFEVLPAPPGHHSLTILNISLPESPSGGTAG